MKNSLYLVLFLVACKSSDADTKNAAACTTALELGKQLELANGIGVDPADPKIDATKKALMGKKYAFKDCAFGSQGGDTVAFATNADAQYSYESIDCAMADGEDGVKKFRRTAMEMDRKKLKLDVSGTVGTHDNRIQLTGCKITPHE